MREIELLNGSRRAAARERAAAPAPDGMPRYRWIRGELLKRIIEGKLRRGDPLPPEGQIAREYGVSLGTVRKAVDELVALDVVARVQGKGLFVATHRSARFMFDLVGEGDEHELPEFEDELSARLRLPDAAERRWLALAPREKVFRVVRTRRFSDGELMLERVILPEKLFPDFARRLGKQRPTLIYEFYEQEFGVSVMNYEERVRAVLADEEQAHVIGCDIGAAVLQVERVAFGYDGTPVEFRTSWCDGASRYYLCSRR
jgi:GntR family transcriptional regulator